MKNSFGRRKELRRKYKETGIGYSSGGRFTSDSKANGWEQGRILESSLSKIVNRQQPFSRTILRVAFQEGVQIQNNAERIYKTIRPSKSGKMETLLEIRTIFLIGLLLSKSLELWLAGEVMGHLLSNDNSLPLQSLKLVTYFCMIVLVLSYNTLITFLTWRRFSIMCLKKSSFTIHLRKIILNLAD